MIQSVQYVPKVVILSVGIKNNEVLRISPRPNMYVNKYWMCDAGRLNAPNLINKNRLVSPQIRKDGQYVVDWNEAINFAIKILKNCKPSETFILASSQASNESNYLLSLLANTAIKPAILDIYLI